MFTESWVRTFVDACFCSLRKTQRVNLALCLVAVLAQSRLTLSGIGRFFPLCRHHRHRVKRVYRFFSNTRIHPQHLFVSFVVHHLALAQRRQPFPILLDDTHIWGNWYVLFASIPNRGRALPLAWAVYDRSKIRGSQNLIEEAFVLDVTRLLYPIKPVFIADRAFGRATFIDFLRRGKLDFILRIDPDTWIWRGKDAGPARRFRFYKNKSRIVRYVAYHKTLKLPVHLVVTHRGAQPEPWYLVTTLDDASEVHGLYQRRMSIDESFRDLKSYLKLRSIQLTNAQRIERLLLVVCLTYLMLTALGLSQVRRHKVHSFVAWKTISRFNVGMTSAMAHPTGLRALLSRWAHKWKTESG